LHEFNSRFEFSDHDWWTVQLTSTYLQRQIEEYFVEYDQRLNEVWKSLLRVRYDALTERWDEIAVGLRQNVQNTWNVRYEVSWTHGQQRESSFGLSVQIELLRF
jgi:hypothetical protein